MHSCMLGYGVSMHLWHLCGTRCLHVCAHVLVLIISFEVVVIVEYSGTNYANCRECSCCKYVMNGVLPVLLLLHISAFFMRLQLHKITARKGGKCIFKICLKCLSSGRLAS